MKPLNIINYDGEKATCFNPDYTLLSFAPGELDSIKAKIKDKHIKKKAMEIWLELDKNLGKE